MKLNKYRGAFGKVKLFINEDNNKEYVILFNFLFLVELITIRQ